MQRCLVRRRAQQTLVACSPSSSSSASSLSLNKTNNKTAIARQLLTLHASHRVLSRAVSSSSLPVRPLTGTVCVTIACALCVATYCIMANWVYEGYVDLWYGVYGVDDEDDEDDD